MVPRKIRLCQTTWFLFLFAGVAGTRLAAESPHVAQTETSVPPARVVSVNGQVRSGNRLLKPGDRLEIGEVVRTDENSGTKLMLADRSIVDLSEGSSLRIESFAPNSGADREVTLSVEKGKVRASIRKKLEGRGKFLLRTPSSVLAVRGTELLLDVSGALEESKVSVLVREGSVAAQFPGKAGAGLVTVQAGRRLDSTATRVGGSWVVGASGFKIDTVSKADLTQAFSQAAVPDRSFLQGVQIREGDRLFQGRQSLQALAVSFKAPPPLPPSFRPDPAQVLLDRTPVRPDSTATLRRSGADQTIDIGSKNAKSVDVSVVFKP